MEMAAIRALRRTTSLVRDNRIRMSRRRVTLLIPCRNAARFLPRLAVSLRAMTVPFDSVLAYDDGSTDDTVAVARSLGIDIITPNPNRGVAFARNRLAEAASTEWIHFHDADDLIDASFLEKLSPLASDEVDVVSCDADWITEEDRTLLIAWRYDANALLADPALHLLVHPLGLNNSIIRRSAWRNVGGCDESLRMWEDADVHLRLAVNGARWRHLPEVLTWSLRDESSFSHDYRANWNWRLSALENYATTLPSRLTPALASQAEIAARNLLRYADAPAASRALALNHRLGGDAPRSAHPVFLIAKRIFPPLLMLRIQEKLRSR